MARHRSTLCLPSSGSVQTRQFPNHNFGLDRLSTSLRSTGIEQAVAFQRHVSARLPRAGEHPSGSPSFDTLIDWRPSFAPCSSLGCSHLLHLSSSHLPTCQSILTNVFASYLQTHALRRPSSQPRWHSFGLPPRCSSRFRGRKGDERTTSRLVK